MLGELFPRDHERYERSRCGAELEAFPCWLIDQGHFRHPSRLHLHRVRKVLDPNRFRSEAMFREADREAFIVPGPSAPMYLCTGRIFSRFLGDESPGPCQAHGSAGPLVPPI
jgi:hypothetical protein